MGEQLASNNPFRDRTGPIVQSTVPPSRNPFLEPSNSIKPSRVDGGERERSHSRKTTTENRPRDDSQRRMNESSNGRPSRHTEASKKSISRPSHSSGPTSKTTVRPHRPRSISETSALDLKQEKHDAERRRERRAREKSSTSGKARKNLDKIDLLDVTGFAAAGGFHHDGPFDACNPHRNKNAKKAPVLAFAKDSTAMTMAAGPPVQPVYFGDHVHNAESFADYGYSSPAMRPGAAVRTASFDPTSKIDPIHGQESIGLGSTTFLEGAPASRSAMLARTNSENGARNELRPRATSDYTTGGLGRKKSMLQKIRGAYKDRANEAQEHASSPPSSPYKHKTTTGYFDESKESSGVTEVKAPMATTTNITFQLTDDGPANVESNPPQSSSSKLSPLYRPPSQGAQPGETSSGTNGLIKRVKSLRVGRKRDE